MARFFDKIASLFRDDVFALSPDQKAIARQRIERQKRPRPDVRDPFLEAQAKYAAEIDRLWHEHSDLREKFLEIAERKISVLDEYGDESWDRLPKLIQECIKKIATRENIGAQEVREWTKNYEAFVGLRGYGPRAHFAEIARRLEQSFKSYHSAQAKRGTGQAKKFDDVSGQEFETHLSRLLGRLGFTDIRGTPASGDQGADLLARKEGRLFVIQAKRYSAAVGNKAVQEVVAALRFYGGDEAWVVTNSRFTRSTVALAQANSVRLVDGTSLSAMAADLTDSSTTSEA